MRLVACAVCIAALALPAAVLADGDPASDYLVVGDAYLPYPPPAARTQLYAALAGVEKANGKVKVAVIATPTDLGSIPSLFGHPADYAKFLALEIRFAYTGALLVVMPAGYGFYDNGSPTPSADAVLGPLSIADKSPEGLTQAAAQAVTALAHAGALTYIDTRKPTALPVPATAHAGKPVKLLYRASDDSGRAAVVLTVLDGSRGIALFKVPLRAAVPGAMYSVTWHVPATAHGALAFCARATDPSGNRSPTTCAKLTVR